MKATIYLYKINAGWLCCINKRKKDMNSQAYCTMLKEEVPLASRIQILKLLLSTHPLFHWHCPFIGKGDRHWWPKCGKKNVVVLLTAHAKSKYLSLMIDIPSMSKMLNSILFCCPDGGVNHTITSSITSHSSLYNRHLTRLFLTLFRILCL